MHNKTESCVDYRGVAFFIKENEERYKEYAVINPNMNTEEIVWRVNNNLDKEKYKFDVIVSDCNNLYVIVNKYFKLAEDYCPPDLVEVDGSLMREAVAEALKCAMLHKKKVFQSG